MGKAIGFIALILFFIGLNNSCASESRPTSPDPHVDAALKRAEKQEMPELPAAAPTDTSTPDSKPIVTEAPAPTKNLDTKEIAITPGVAPDVSLRWLTNGNIRFVKKAFRADGKSKADRIRVASAYKPHAIILSCSDARVPPELIFDQALGEVEVVRVLGEMPDSATIASIEHGVQNLGVRLIVVMGHTSCAAIHSTLNTPEGESTGSSDMDVVINDIRPRLKSVKPDQISPNLEVESALNADGVARELTKRSNYLRKKVEQGHLVIKSALYRLESGKVSFY